MMEKNAKIYVAGHRGMVGSAIVRELQRQGYTNIITRTHKELDLTRQDAVEEFFAQEKPEYVFLAAAKVGGIVANQEALADFMYDNMTLEMNAIHSAWKNGCKKLEFLGSSCIYPRMAPQPMQESCLLTSELEKTNEAYALAKISGLKYCEFLNRQYGTDYISVMPTNLYGPNDNYHPTHSHVVPALIRRFHEAKEQNILNDPVLLKFMAVGYHFPVGYAIINSTKHYGEGPTWSNDAFVHTVCRSWKRGRSSVPTAAGNLQGATRRAVFRQAPCWQAGIPWATSRAWTARASSTGAWRTTALSG